MFKMYFWVRTDLGMRKGKTAGQVGHAAARLSREIPQDIWNEYLEYEVKYVYRWSGPLVGLSMRMKSRYIQIPDFVTVFYDHLVIDEGGVQIPKNTETVYGVFTNLDLNKNRQFKLLS